MELLDGATVSYVDGGPFIIAGQPYRGTINSSSNPLDGVNAFVADSWGYTASQLNLSSFAGHTFKYRFRVGTNSSGNDFGWFVDDIRIYTCAICAQNRVLDDAYNGVADAYRASVSIQAGGGFTVGEMDDVTISAPQVQLNDGFEARGPLTIDDTACIFLPPG